MILPSNPVKGQPIEDKIREMLTFMRSIRITSFAGGTVSETANGTTLSLGRAKPFDDNSKSGKTVKITWIIYGESGPSGALLYFRDGLLIDVLTVQSADPDWWTELDPPGDEYTFEA